MSNGGLLDCILGNTKPERDARNKYIKKLEREIMEYRRQETFAELTNSFSLPPTLGS